MVPAASMSTGTAPGVLVADVSFRPTSPEEGRFTRADLVFSGSITRDLLRGTRVPEQPDRGREHAPDSRARLRWAVRGLRPRRLLGTKATARSPTSPEPGPTFALLTR